MTNLHSPLQPKNAIIERATLTAGNHGMLSAWLFLKFDSASGQGFGGYSLYLPKSFSHHKIESVAGHFIWRCMEIAGVESWDKLPCKAIRVIGSHSQIDGIGHIINDDWFFPRTDFLPLTEAA